MTDIARILVPTDFSAASDAALTYARSLARQFGASINLVHVFEDPFTSGAFIGDGTVTHAARFAPIPGASWPGNSWPPGTPHTSAFFRSARPTC